MKILAKAALGALMLAGATLATAQPAAAYVGIEFGFGGPDYAFGDPCDYYDYYYEPPPWGLPPDYCDYPVWFEPVWFDGYWYQGPIYYRWYHGRRLFWLHGGWREDTWRGPRPARIEWQHRGGSSHGFRPSVMYRGNPRSAVGGERPWFGRDRGGNGPSFGRDNRGPSYGGVDRGRDHGNGSAVGNYRGRNDGNPSYGGGERRHDDGHGSAAGNYRGHNDGDRSFGGGDRSYGGGDRSFGGGDRSYGGGDRSFGGGNRGFGGGSEGRGGFGGGRSSGGGRGPH